MKDGVPELVRCPDPGCGAIICLAHGFVWMPPKELKKAVKRLQGESR